MPGYQLLLVDCLLLSVRDLECDSWMDVIADRRNATVGLTLSALIVFLTSYPKNIGDQSYSSGFIAALLSCALNLVSACLYLIDCTLLRQIAKAYSGHQHKLLISFMMAMWYVIIGGFIFAALEEWPYEESVEFVVVTLLTIGMRRSLHETILQFINW